MWQNYFEKALSSGFFSKVFSSVIIVVITVIVVVVVNILFERWRNNLAQMSVKGRAEQASSLDTQITMIRRLVIVSLFFLSLVLVLMQYEAVHDVGTGLLASAGVVGLVVGMAAQNTFSNIIAGITISFSQPVRLNDAVLFEGDFGWVEEISLMHTVIRTWDNRRVVVPNGVLVNKVVQNWTLKDTSLLGSVMLYVDYYCDIDKIRAWVNDIVKNSSHWSKDGEPGVQVVDFTDKAMVLRILAKGKDAPSTWNLRCELREKLIKKFQQANLPLPRIRIEGKSIG